MLPGFGSDKFSELSRFREAAQAAVTPGEVTIEGAVYACGHRLGEEGLQPLEEGGFFQRQELQIWISKTRLPAPPALKASIIFGGETFIVEGIDHHEAVFTDWLIRAGKSS